MTEYDETVTGIFLEMFCKSRRSKVEKLFNDGRGLGEGAKV